MRLDEIGDKKIFHKANDREKINFREVLVSILYDIYP